MDWITTLLIAISLAMDALAVSVGIGTSGKADSARPVFRLSFHMGLFQGLMTLLGWLLGESIVGFISGIDHWVAMGLLGFVGFRMIRSGFNPNEEIQAANPSRGGSLMLISIATSIDALAVGVSLAMLEVHILGVSAVIAIVTMLLSLGGLLAGNLLGVRFGKRMEILGGFILIGIGLRILVSHLA